MSLSNTIPGRFHSGIWVLVFEESQSLLSNMWLEIAIPKRTKLGKRQMVVA